MISGIWHNGIHVSDLDQSIAFYRDILGLHLVHAQESTSAYISALVGFPEAHLRIAQLAIPSPGPRTTISSHDVELVEYRTPKGTPSAARRCDPGTTHLAFTVDDIDQAYRQLTGHGVRFVSPPNYITAGVNAGGATCYFLDPDGYTLELVQPPPREGS